MTDNQPGTMNWSLWIRWLLIACLGAELCWIVFDHVLSWNDWFSLGSVGRSFEMGEERNASTWFQVLQATLAGFTAFGIYYMSAGQETCRWTLRGWVATGAFFVYLGIDEGAMLHENLASAIRDGVGGPQGYSSGPIRWFLGIDTHNWQLFLLPFLAVAGLLVFIFLWKQLDRFGLRKWLLLGWSCYLVAIVMDFLQGRDNFFWDIASAMLWEEGEVEHYWAVAEETLEMLGTTLVWQGLMRHLACMTDGLTLSFTRDAD
jgi:hypothetical protein